MQSKTGSFFYTETGGGTVEPAASNGFRLHAPPNTGDHYQNAQITDYLPEMRFRHAPERGGEVAFSCTAWIEGVQTMDAVRGTAGFGFWNHPFSPDSRRLRLPRAVWFFYASPPGNMALARGVPGFGWKADIIDATTPRAWSLIPFAPLAVPLFNTAWGERTLYPFVQRRLGIGEHALPTDLLLTAHDYAIVWRRDGVRFSVDAETVLHTPAAPHGKCGFIAWIDNQYAIVTPQGRFGAGVLSTPGGATLVLENIALTDSA